MNLIACIDSKWGIGKDNDLLIKIPEDLAFFKEKTTGKVIVMGRKTLQSFPKGPLKNRINVILTSNIPEPIIDELYVTSVKDCIDLLSKYNSEDIYIIGGGSIYAQFLPYCDTAYLTRVHKDFDADTFFPELSNDEWEITDISALKEYEGITYRFYTYKRRRPHNG